jgi:dihydroorotase
LTEDRASEYDPIFKVNPPLRAQSDVEALRLGLVDGTIDVIATDHAPHPKESKDTDWASAAFGMVGLETAYSIASLVLIESGKSNYQRLAEVMSENAARISGLGDQGNYLNAGSMANLTLVDPSVKWLPKPQTLSMSENNPYSGIPMQGRVKHTIYNGEFSYKDFQIVERVGL